MRPWDATHVADESGDHGHNHNNNNNNSNNNNDSNNNSSASGGKASMADRNLRIELPPHHTGLEASASPREVHQTAPNTTTTTLPHSASPFAAAVAATGQPAMSRGGDQNLAAAAHQLNLQKSALALLEADISNKALRDATKGHHISSSSSPHPSFAATVPRQLQELRDAVTQQETALHALCLKAVEEDGGEEDKSGSRRTAADGGGGGWGRRKSSVAAAAAATATAAQSAAMFSPASPHSKDDDSEGGVTAGFALTDSPLDVNIDSPHIEDIGMDAVLRDAAHVRGLRLSWLLYLISFVVVLLFVLLFVQLSYTTEHTIKESGKRAIESIAVSTVNNLEMLLFELEELFDIVDQLRQTNTTSITIRGRSICSRLYGAPVVLAHYDAYGVMTWSLDCPTNGDIELPKTLSTTIMDKRTRPDTVQLVQYSHQTLLAYGHGTDMDTIAAVLDKGIIGRFMFSNYLASYSTSTLQSAQVGLLLPNFNDSKLVVALHSLSYSEPSYTLPGPTNAGAALLSVYERLCQPGSNYVWHTVVHDPYNDEKAQSRINKNTMMTSTIHPMPSPYVEYSGAWRLPSQMSLCAAHCIGDDTKLCTVDNPTTRWLSIDSDLDELQQDRTLNAVGGISIAATVIFFAVTVVAYVGIASPVKFIRFQLMKTVGSADKQSDFNRMQFRWTSHLWLGDLTALVRAIHVLSLCFKLNKKYVPEHALRRYAKELYFHRGSLNVLKACLLSSSSSDDDEDDEDSSRTLHRVPSAAWEVAGDVPPSSSPEDRALALDGSRAKKAGEVSEVPGIISTGGTTKGDQPPLSSVLSQLRAVGHHSTTVGEDGGEAPMYSTTFAVDMMDASMTVGEMEASFIAAVPGYAQAHMEVKRSEDATILCVRLADIHSAYLLNYGLAHKQHRRLMKFLLSRIRQHKGVVFHRSGDCLAAAWNAFDSCYRHAEYAAGCARDIANAFARYRAEGLQVGIVLHQGAFVCGTVDDSKEAFATAFGDGPRQAIALADFAASQPAFNILVTEPVKQALSAQYECLIVDVINAVELTYPLIVFDLALPRAPTASSPEGSPKNSDVAIKYARIFSYFRHHQFKEAMDSIRSMRLQCPNNKAELLVRRLERLCWYFELHPNELPMPYCRPYPTWVNYEFFAELESATAALAEAKGANSSEPKEPEQLLLPEVLYQKAPRVYEEMLTFKRELHDNVRRLGTPAHRSPYMQPKSSSALQSGGAQSGTVSQCVSPPFLCTTGLDHGTANVSDASLLPPPALGAPAITATRHSDVLDSSGDAVAKGGSTSTVADSQPRQNMLSHSNASLPSSAVNSGGELTQQQHVDPCGSSQAPDEDLTASQRCFSFTHTANQHLQLPLDPSYESPFYGSQADRRGSFLSLHSSGAAPLRQSHSIVRSVGLSQHDRGEATFRSASFAVELPTEITAKNGTTYMRSARVLGRGSFGSVYLGMDIHSGKLVAIKFLSFPSDESEVDGIEAEVLIMQRVKDSHVVEFISYAFLDESIVIVMECMMAGSLHNMMSSFKIIPNSTARLFMRDVLRGLQKLHSMGVVHRDVKPQNVLLTLAGNCKISDFGASAWLHDIVRKEAQGLVLGTPVYLAPEAARGMPEEGSDIWSCGIMFIQLITGKLPYGDDQLQLPPGVLVFHIGSGLVVPTIPDDLDELDREFVELCLQTEPGDRRTATQLLQMPLFSL